MPNRREDISLLAVCSAFLLLSVAGIVAAFATRLVTNIDGLFLILVCLVMGGIFALMLFSIAQDAGWLPSRKKKEAAPAGAKVQSVKPGEGK